jgi:hypothetical protein
LGEDGGLDCLVDPDHAQDAAFRRGFPWDFNERGLFSLVEKLLCPRDGDPLARASGVARFKVFRVIITFFRRVEIQLNRRWRRIFNGGFEFRIRLRLEPKQAADAETHDQHDAGD